MVESWVGSMSRLLPRAIGEGGHRFTFLTRDLHHYLSSGPVGETGPHPLLAAENVLSAPTNELPALLEYTRRAHRLLGFDGVISACDYYLPAAARIAEALGLPGPAPEAVTAACRKDATRERLASAGVPGPAFAVCRDGDELADAAARLGYPLVIKPVDLCAGMLVRRVADERELARAYQALAAFPVNARGQRRSTAVLLEELLDGPEVSVETVSRGGACQVVGVTDKSLGGAPAFVETGHLFPSALPPEAVRAAADTAVSALAALGLDQVVAHTEIRLTARGPRVVEVNPRPAGNRITELVRQVTGIDLPAAAVELALGHEPDLTPGATGVGSAAIRFLLPEGPDLPSGGAELGAFDGTDQAASLPGVRELRLAEAGRPVTPATSNNDYLGHVLTTAPDGSAGERAGEALSLLRPRWAAPVGGAA